MLDRLASLASIFGGNKLAALDIGTNSLKLAEVEASARGPILKKFSVLPLPVGQVTDGEIADITAVSQNIQSIAKSAKSSRKNLAIGLNGSSVIVKKISMPKMDQNLVAEQIRWEAEQYIPFDINEISLDYHVLQSRASSESMEVLLVAVKQEILFRCIEAAEMAGMKLATADVAGFALANCFEANYGVMNDAVALLNVGASVTNFVVVERGEVVFCRDIVVGGDFYTNEIAKLMSISRVEAEALKISATLGQEAPADVSGIIAGANEQVVDEIRNSFEFYGATSGGAPSINRFYMSGGSVHLPGLRESIAQATGVKHETFNPFQKISYDPKAFRPDFIGEISSICPIALGLALRKPGDR